ncbi:MAG: hypothetical protein AB8G17_07840 [Gammaproteobacteria bacterium]
MNQSLRQVAIDPVSPLPTRQVFHNADDAREATYEVARSARRSLCLFTQDLEPDVYDRIEFLDIVKNLVLTHKFARVRILIKHPVTSDRHATRLVEMSRRFSSFLEIRQIHADAAQRRDAFLLADQSGVMYRTDARRHEGIADTRSAAVTIGYLEFFDTLWDKSETARELRLLHL